MVWILLPPGRGYPGVSGGRGGAGRNPRWWFLIHFSRTSILQKLVFRLDENHFLSGSELGKIHVKLFEKWYWKKDEKNAEHWLTFQSIYASPGHSWTSLDHFLVIEIELFSMRGPLQCPSRPVGDVWNWFKQNFKGFGGAWGIFAKDLEGIM